MDNFLGENFALNSLRRIQTGRDDLSLKRRLIGDTVCSRVSECAGCGTHEANARASRQVVSDLWARLYRYERPSRAGHLSRYRKPEISTGH